MLSNNVFCTQFSRNFAFVALACLVFTASSCTGRKNAEEVHEATAEIELTDDWQEETDTLVYDIQESPVSEAVDESFLDFFYTFLHRRGFQLERVKYPVEVKDDAGNVVETLTNGRSISEALHFLDMEYLVMLLGMEDDPYDYLSSDAIHAELQQLTLSNGKCRSYTFDRGEEGWKFTGIHHGRWGSHEAFGRFYRHFVSDSVYRDNHLAEEIFIAIPSTENEMEMVDGNIDNSQWDVFAPELPSDQLLLLNLGEPLAETDGVKFVKCSVASSMMEVLTFEKDDNEWKLVRYEE